VHDATGALVIFGGSSSSGASDTSALLNDVWAFFESGSPSGWCQLFGFDPLVPGQRADAPACVLRMAGASAGPNASLYGNRDRNGAALPAPGPTQDAAVAVVGRWLVSFGGIEVVTREATVSGTLRVFDLTSGRWAKVASSGEGPGPRYAAAAAPFLLSQSAGVEPSPYYGGEAASAVARAALAGSVPGLACVGGMAVHGGRPPRGSQAAGGVFDALSSLWSVAIDQDACGACTSATADPPPSGACPCACASAPGREWSKPPSSGYQWHRAYHTMSWVPAARALAAFGGYARISEQASGGSVGLVYSDTLMLPLAEEGTPPWKRHGSVGPPVRFSHAGAASAGSRLVVFGGRFRDLLRDTWALDIPAAIGSAVAVTEGDFGVDITDLSGLLTVQVLVGVLVVSACLLCGVAFCVRRSGSRGEGGAGGAVGVAPGAGAGGAAMQSRSAAQGLTMHDIAKLKRLSWPLTGPGASAGEAADGPPAAVSSQTQCPVCLEEFARGDAVRVLPCSHIGHPACMDPWLRRSHKCPLCKQDVLQALEAQG